MSIKNMGFVWRRDSVLREAESLEKRLKAIHEQVTELNTQIQPTMPKEMPWTPCNTCGSVSLRCGCD